MLTPEDLSKIEAAITRHYSFKSDGTSHLICELFEYANRECVWTWTKEYDEDGNFIEFWNTAHHAVGDVEHGNYCEECGGKITEVKDKDNV